MPTVDAKISELTPTALLLGGETFPVVQGAVTKGAAIPFQSDTSGAAPKIGFGGAVDDTARVGVSNVVSRDGQGTGMAWMMELTRSVDVNPSTSNPLNHGVRLTSTVQAAVTQPVREWAFTSIAEDLSGIANAAVALTGQGRRHGGGSAVWSLQANSLDYVNNGTGLGSATRNIYGAEINVQGDGDDTQQTRVILHVVAHDMADVYASPVGTNRHGIGVSIMAQTADLYYGLRTISPGGAQIDVGATLQHQGRRGIEITSALSEYGVICTGSATITTAAFADASATQHGFYAQGVYGTAAIRIKEDNWIMLGQDTGGTSESIRMRFNSGTRKIEFYRGTNRVGYIDVTTADHAL